MADLAPGARRPGRMPRDAAGGGGGAYRGSPAKAKAAALQHGVFSAMSRTRARARPRAALPLHVHRGAQPVAHQVEADRGDEDHSARQRRQRPG